jgi:mannose-1-phosphate guanylyltransferase
VKAVVLVGGEGTRLRPLTLDTPKQLLAVVEVRMIERVLGHLAGHGVDEAVLSVGYLPDAFLSAYPDGKACGIRLMYAVDPLPLDTGGAIRFAAMEAGVEETFLAVNGDVLTDADLSALIAFHRRVGAETTLHLAPVKDPSAFGVVLADQAGRVQAFLEKPGGPPYPSRLINAGTYVMEPSVLDRIPAGGPVSVERHTFPSMVADGTLWAWASDAYWMDVGTLPSYLAACQDLISGVRGSPPAPGARDLGERCWATGSPVIDGEIEGPALVADAAFVAREARVSGSVIGIGARVEGGAVVEGSVVMAGAVVGAGAVVEGSIVGEGARVGAKAWLSDLCVVGNRVTVADGARASGARMGP